MGDGEARFIVDVNVGKLSRWLRVLGFDALFINPIEDGRLVDIALREKRVVVTKDTHIGERRLATGGSVRVVLVQGERAADQLRFVVEELGLRGSFRPFSRCIECNASLEAIEREQVRERVPPYVYSTQQRYMICPNCHKVYWPGTHWQRMSEMLSRLMPSANQPNRDEPG